MDEGEAGASTSAEGAPKPSISRASGSADVGLGGLSEGSELPEPAVPDPPAKGESSSSPGPAPSGTWPEMDIFGTRISKGSGRPPYFSPEDWRSMGPSVRRRETQRYKERLGECEPADGKGSPTGQEGTPPPGTTAENRASTNATAGDGDAGGGSIPSGDAATGSSSSSRTAAARSSPPAVASLCPPRTFGSSRRTLCEETNGRSCEKYGWVG